VRIVTGGGTRAPGLTSSRLEWVGFEGPTDVDGARARGQARRLYEREGYLLTAEERHYSFGHHLVGQDWELIL
jgi:hypothetical protein